MRMPLASCKDYATEMAQVERTSKKYMPTHFVRDWGATRIHQRRILVANCAIIRERKNLCIAIEH
jgi:hypothetical protein